MLLAYLIKRIFFHIVLFFKHWYVDSGRFAYGTALGLLRRLENKMALRINVRFLFQPLYQEYNFVGYVLGFVFRSGRILMGGVAALIGFLAIGVAYIFWAFVPIFFVAKIFYPENF